MEATERAHDQTDGVLTPENQQVGGMLQLPICFFLFNSLLPWGAVLFLACHASWRFRVCMPA
jgi:hypothetical protein